MRSAAYLPRDRFDVASAYLHPPGDPGTARLWDTAHAHGMPMISIPDRRAIDRRAIRQLVDLCKRRRVDVWHSHDYKTDCLGPIIRRRCPRIKLVSTVHGFTRENLKTRLYARLNNLALLRFDHVFAVSPALVRHCAQHGVHPDRLSYLPNAIEVSSYPFSSNRAVAHNESSPALAVLGRLSKEKGVDRALRLFACLRGEHADASLHLIGDGPERGRLEQLAEQLNIAPSVSFHGWSAEPADLLASMDVLLLTSHTEGMPNVLLEAMALGVAIAATAVGGVPEMLEQGACGVLLAGNDTKAWAHEVAPLLTPNPRRASMQLNARRRIESHYAFDARMQRIRDRYETLCASDDQRKQTRVA